MITADKRGPYHTILKLGYHGKIHELLKSNNNEVLKVYATKLLPQAVGKSFWNTCTKAMNYEVFVTRSDEALALLLIENGSRRWLDKLKHPNKEKKNLAFTKYTQGTPENKTPGWSEEGLYRYADLMGQVSRNLRDTDWKTKMTKLIEDEFNKKDTLRSREKTALERMRKNGELVDNERIIDQRAQKKQRVNDFLLNMMSNTFDPCDIMMEEV